MSDLNTAFCIEKKDEYAFRESLKDSNTQPIMIVKLKSGKLELRKPAFRKPIVVASRTDKRSDENEPLFYLEQ
jgi:hypothetical protein